MIVDRFIDTNVLLYAALGARAEPRKHTHAIMRIGLRRTLLAVVIATLVADAAGAQTPPRSGDEKAAIDTWVSICRSQAPAYAKSAQLAVSAGYERQKPGVYVKRDTLSGFVLASSPATCGCTVTFRFSDVKQSMPVIRNALAARHRLKFEQDAEGDFIAPLTVAKKSHQVLITRRVAQSVEWVGIVLTGAVSCPADLEAHQVSVPPT